MVGKNENLHSTLIINPKEEKIDDKPYECKGLFWRGSLSCYVSQHKSIETRKSLRLLKRKSCTGCVKCEWIKEFLGEMVYNDQPFDCIPDIEHGAIYTIQFIESQGYYDTYPEVDGFECIKLDT